MKTGARLNLPSAAVLALFLAAPAHAADVVINEIMFHPPHDHEGLQYIEIFNNSPTQADIGGWTLRKGVEFNFPISTRLPPGGFIVVCRSRAEFVERYGRDVSLTGEFSGRLSHSGERLELADATGRVIDSVKYSDRAPWPLAADGASASLERISPQLPGADPANWAPSILPRITAPAGTPGKTNDAFSPNPPPAVSQVERAPAVPTAAQPVTVQATIADADGVRAATLLVRVLRTREAGEEISLPMRRVSGDASSGRYEAVIPGQPDGSIVRYRIRATDNTQSTRVEPSTNDLRTAWSFGIFANTNRARIPFAFLRHGTGPTGPAFGLGRSPFGGALNVDAPRGEDALVLMPPEGAPVQLFDFIRATSRKGGFKARFLKDNPLRDMTTVDVIFETPRAALSEPLSFALYRLAGVPAPLAEHWRLWVDGRPRGYQLVFEQPNKSFLARNGRDTSGNLYKLLWYGNGIVGQHEKKTNLQGDHDDLLAVLKGLEDTEGATQWNHIAKHFNVTNFIDYYVVNMCIQNWDGFFNNYFTYHDTGGTGRWEIYPWDEDKTWGDFDGASERHDWYSMPLTFGMNGDQPPGIRARPGARSPRFNFRAGAMWWRQPGCFSGPLLANAEFRQRFLARLRVVTETLFTPERMNSLIDALEQRLEPEIAPAELKQFRADIQSFRDQVIGRRKFILNELEKETK